jgi:hypothetical protein
MKLEAILSINLFDDKEAASFVVTRFKKIKYVIIGFMPSY